MKILLLEDDFVYRESVSEYLESLGYEVDEAADGKVACDKIAAGFYHLLILDIKVPHISGHEVIKYAKDIGCESTVPIIPNPGVYPIPPPYMKYGLPLSSKPIPLSLLRYPP